MGNSAQIVITSGADQSGFQLVATFNTYSGDYATPVRFCSRVVLVSGMSPSYAFVGMPCKSFPADEEAFSIALKKGGPAGAILLRSRCSISYSEGPGKSVNLLNGNLVKYGHNIDEDSIVGEVYDDRWILGKLTTFGRFVWDPSGTDASGDLCYFDAASPLTFNKMGYPDCLDHPIYGPVFAPSFKFGWQTGSYEQSQEPGAGYATKATRSWTVGDAIRYFKNFYSSQSFRGAFRNSQLDYGTMTLPSFIQWNDSAGVFDGSTRTLKDVNVNNESLLSALQALARKAGAIDLYIKPLPNMMSSVCFLEMNPKTNTGSRLFLPDYADSPIADLMNAGDIVQSGYVSESVINQFDDTTICGDPATVERYCQVQPDSTFTVKGQPCLEPAEGATFDLFKQYVIDNQGGVDTNSAQEAFQSATLIYPDALCSFRIFRNTPVFGDTKWANHQLGIRYPRMKPAQLTSYNNGDQNPRNFQPREIVVEYKMTTNEIALREDQARISGDGWVADDAHIWFPAYRYDNLTLNPDSTILYMSALRDAKQTWRQEGVLITVDDGGGHHHLQEGFPDIDNTGYLGEYDGRYIYRRQVRLNVAIESDWLITGRDTTDPNNVARRIDPNAAKFTWLTVSQPLDYVDYNRVKSRPNGNAQVKEPWKTTNYPDKCSLGNELFSDISSGRLPDHASKRQADVNRIDYSGELFVARMNPSLIPGLPLSVEGSNTIPTFAVVKCSIFDANAQGVTVQFGPPDSKEIYDLPGKYSGNHGPLGSGALSGNSTTTDSGRGGGTGFKKPGYDEETGGKSNTQENTTSGGKNTSSSDGYEDNPSGLGGKDTKKQQASGSDERTERGPSKTTSDETKSSSPGTEGSFMIPDSHERRGGEKQGRQARHEKAKAVAQEAKAKRAARTPDAGFGGAFGKPNSGSINGKDSSQLQLGDALLGKNTSGTINGRKSLKGMMNSIGDTRKANAYDRASYKSTPRDNASFGAIAKAFGKANSGQQSGAQVGAKAQDKAKQFAPTSPKSDAMSDALNKALGGKSSSGSGIKKDGESFADFQKRHPIKDRE